MPTSKGFLILPRRYTSIYTYWAYLYLPSHMSPTTVPTAKPVRPLYPHFHYTHSYTYRATSTSIPTLFTYNYTSAIVIHTPMRSIVGPTFTYIYTSAYRAYPCLHSIPCICTTSVHPIHSYLQMQLYIYTYIFRVYLYLRLYLSVLILPVLDRTGKIS